MEGLQREVVETALRPRGWMCAVNRSPYAEVRGIPLAAAGLFFYGSVGLLLLLSLCCFGFRTERGALLSLAALLCAGAAFRLCPPWPPAFAIGAFCKLCLLTYRRQLAALDCSGLSAAAGRPCPNWFVSLPGGCW